MKRTRSKTKSIKVSKSDISKDTSQSHAHGRSTAPSEDLALWALELSNEIQMTRAIFGYDPYLRKKLSSCIASLREFQAYLSRS